jgi:hypothetical protein
MYLFAFFVSYLMHFLSEYFRMGHSEQVINCMETIMMYVIQESDDVHAELASCLLQNLTREAQVIPYLLFALTTNSYHLYLNSYPNFPGNSPSIFWTCREGSRPMQRQAQTSAS